MTQRRRTTASSICPRVLKIPSVLDAQEDRQARSTTRPSSGGDTACVVDVSQTWDGTTVWHIVFTADIKFR